MLNTREALGQFIGKPILEAILWVYGKLRERAYAGLEGRHYQFRTNPIDVVEGVGSERWLALSDVRRTVADLPGFPSLRHMYPRGVRRDDDDDDGAERIEARTLLSALAKAHDLRTRRFSEWLRREVVFPAEKKALRKGSR